MVNTALQILHIVSDRCRHPLATTTSSPLLQLSLKFCLLSLCQAWPTLFKLPTVLNVQKSILTFVLSCKERTWGELGGEQLRTCIMKTSLKQPTSKIVAVPRVDPWDSGCMAGGGSIVIQRQGNAMPSGIDVHRMPKPIVEIGAWQKTCTKWKKTVQETTVFFKPLFASNLWPQICSWAIKRENCSWKELITSGNKLT